MAKPNRKVELALWWEEYRSKIISFTLIVLTIVIILAVFYPFSSDIVIGKVNAVTSSDPKTGTLPMATIYSSKTGEIALTVPIGVTLTIGDNVEISRGKTIAGIYRYVFVKKILPHSKSLQSGLSESRL
jgi:hypothetical protein